MRTWPLTVIVSGVPVRVVGSPSTLARTLIVRALRASGQAVALQAGWELRRVDGTLLDPACRCADLAIGLDARLYLSPSVGVGAACRARLGVVATRYVEGTVTYPNRTRFPSRDRLRNVVFGRARHLTPTHTAR